MKYIGFIGHARSGKDTAADCVGELLLEYNLSHARRSLAHPIKQIAQQVFGWDGEKDERGRDLLIDLGMAGRKYDESLWLDKAVNYFHIAGGDFRLIPDIRFENEADFIWSDGILIRVIRESVEPMEHVSERGLDNYLTAITVHNNGSREELKSDLEAQLLEVGIL